MAPVFLKNGRIKPSIVIESPRFDQEEGASPAPGGFQLNGVATKVAPRSMKNSECEPVKLGLQAILKKNLALAFSPQNLQSRNNEISISSSSASGGSLNILPNGDRARLFLKKSSFKRNA